MNFTTKIAITLVISLGFTSQASAGFPGNSSIGDFVWLDENGNGVQDAGEPGIGGVSVELFADFFGDGTIDDAVATTTTDSFGFYDFSPLEPGFEYQVVFNTPNGFVATPLQVGGNPTIDSDGPISEVIVLGPSEFNDSIDAGFFQTGGIGDLVFADLDADGIQDAGEPGIAGVFVDLLADLDGDGATDDVVATTMTDSSGAFAFTDLTPGVEFQVQFETPAGLTPSPFQAGGDPNNDSNGPLSGVIVLQSGEFNSSIDAGFVPEPGSLALLGIGALFAARRRNH